MHFNLRILVLTLMGISSTSYATSDCLSYLDSFDPHAIGTSVSKVHDSSGLQIQGSSDIQVQDFPSNQSMSSTDTKVQDFSDYKIERKGIKHIISGDIVKVKLPGGQFIHQISGGLHTEKAVHDFLKLRPDIKSLFQYRESIDGWYSDNIVGNGTIYVRLPESAYTKKGLKSLWSSDLNFNGGYLWKTLFPQDLTDQDIIELIQQGLNNPNRVTEKGWSTVINSNVVMSDGETLSLTIYLDTINKKVVSAFPSYDQPLRYTQSRNLLGIHKQNVTIINTDGQIDFAKGQAEELRHYLSAFKTAKRRIQSVDDWNELSRDQKIKMISSHVFSVIDLSGGHIGGFDLSLRLLADQVEYTPGGVYLFAGQLLLYILNDRTISAPYKYELLKRMLVVTVINDDSVAFDLLWAKFILNLVLNSERLFEWPVFERLLEMTTKSPIFWTLLVPTFEGSFQRKSVERTFTGFMNVLKDFKFDRQAFDDHPFDRMQIDNLAPIYNLYRSYWRSEYQFLKRLTEIPSLGPNGDSGYRTKKYLVDYINASVLYLYFTKNSLLQRVFPIFSSNSKNLKAALHLLKRFDPKFEVPRFLNYIDFLLGSPKRALQKLRRLNNTEDERGFIKALESFHQHGGNQKLNTEGKTLIMQLYIDQQGDIGHMMVVIERRRPEDSLPKE